MPQFGAVELIFMRFKTTFALTTEGKPDANAHAAVHKIKEDFAAMNPVFIVFFAATEYDPDILAADMHDAFPGAVTMGCTTAGEKFDDKTLNGSVVAMAFSDDVFDFSETVLVLADRAAARAAGGTDVFSDSAEALDYLGKSVGKPLIDLDYREYVGFMLGDKTSPFTEAILERTGEMTDVFLVGGFAGDDQKFAGLQTVFYRGKAYRDGAAALALWKPKKGFALLKTQAVELTDKQVVITKADEDRRIIWEFDGRDAVDEYAEIIGVPSESMNILDFDGNPLGLVANGEPYLRAIMKKVDGKGLQMYAQIWEGMRQTVTRSGDILKVTARDLALTIEETGTPAAILHIDCVSRHTGLRNAGQVDAFARLFSYGPHISFSSYGEIYVNTLAFTSVMILFK